MIRRFFVLLSSLVCLLTLAPAAFACQYDNDCRPGVRCVKARGNLYGACQSVSVGGDSRASLDDKGKLDIKRTYSRSCRQETDCPLDYRCSRASGSSNGVCIRTGVLLPDSIKSDAKADPSKAAKSAAKSN